MKRMKVVRVTKDEVEFDDGSIQPMMFELGYVPTVEQMQELWDNAANCLGIKVEDGEESQHRQGK